jgi:hypothetical protein
MKDNDTFPCVRLTNGSDHAGSHSHCAHLAAAGGFATRPAEVAVAVHWFRLLRFSPVYSILQFTGFKLHPIERKGCNNPVDGEPLN